MIERFVGACRLRKLLTLDGGMLTSARRRARRAVVLVVASVASIGAPALASPKTRTSSGWSGDPMNVFAQATTDQQVGIDEQCVQDHAQFGFQFTPSKQERMSGEMGRQCGNYALQQS